MWKHDARVGVLNAISPYVHCQLQLFLNRDFRFVYLFTTVVTSTVDTVTGMLVVIYPYGRMDKQNGVHEQTFRNKPYR